MMAFACRFVSEEVAEDMVQDVFVMYWEKRASMSPDSIRSFLFKCTQNQCLNFLKHQNVVRDWEDNVRLAIWLKNVSLSIRKHRTTVSRGITWLIEMWNSN